MKKIYDDVVGMLGSGAELEGEYLRSSRKSDPSTTAKSQINDAQIIKKKSKDEDILSARKTVKKVNHKSGCQLRAYVRRQREGVSTRSMTRFTGLKN